MKFAQPLLEGIFKRRYKRFLADIEYAGQTVVAHVPNTGSMKGCNTAESACRFSRADGASRRLAYTLEMIKAPTSWVGVNTARSNALVWELWESQLYPPWRNFDRAQREVKINAQTRIDLVMWNSAHVGFPAPQKLSSDLLKQSAGGFHIVEIKNVTLAENGVAMFPDAVTERGQKHITELMHLMAAGHSAEIVFTVQRQDCHSFTPALAIDPEYAHLLSRAAQQGLKISALPCYLDTDEIRLQPTALDFIAPTARQP